MLGGGGTLDEVNTLLKAYDPSEQLDEKSTETPEFNWRSQVALSDRQIETAQLIKSKLKGFTLKEAEDILIGVREHLPLISVVT